MKKTTFLTGLLLLGISAASFGADNTVVSKEGSTIRISLPPAETDHDAQWKKMVRDGESWLHTKRSKEAIEKYFDPVIVQFNSLNSTNTAQVYCAKDSKESRIYLLQAAALSEKNEADHELPVFGGSRFAHKKGNAEVLPQFGAEAFFLKTYALIELGQIGQAKEIIQTAVGLSPLNFAYLAELGHIYQTEENWKMALAAFEAAEKAVEFSDPDQKDENWARAWRGIGFVYIEQGKLQEAKAKYKQCLELNPNDKKAMAELKYIANLELKQTPRR